MEHPTPIRTDGSNHFAWHSMSVRVPAILEEVRKLNPDYPSEVHDGLAHLAEAMASDAPLPRLTLPAVDYDSWAAYLDAHAGDTWLNTVWYAAEHYVYHLVVQITRWWETGRDPFAPKKGGELANPALWDYLEQVLNHGEAPYAERLSATLEAALWGNRIDLSYAIAAAHGREASADDLLTDERAQALDHLLRGREESPPETIHLIADNAGTELAVDLALVDQLLQRAATVILHVKMHPTFVSDVIADDVQLCLAEMGRRSEITRLLAKRLRSAFNAGRFRVAPDPFWTSPAFMWEMPARLEKTFKDAALVIAKGDVNYRRLTGDALWDETTPFGETTAYFAPPLLAVRTLKSDSIVGLPEGTPGAVGGRDPQWRISGKHGVIQFKA